MGANAKLRSLGLRPGDTPAGIIVIAEICRRLYGRDFKDVIRAEVYKPCGMADSWWSLVRLAFNTSVSRSTPGRGAKGMPTDSMLSRPLTVLLIINPAGPVVQPAGDGESAFIAASRRLIPPK